MSEVDLSKTRINKLRHRHDKRHNDWEVCECCIDAIQLADEVERLRRDIAERNIDVIGADAATDMAADKKEIERLHGELTKTALGQSAVEANIKLLTENDRLREAGIQAFLMGFSRGKDVPITGFPPDGQLNEWAHQAVDEIARAALPTPAPAESDDG